MKRNFLFLLLSAFSVGLFFSCRNQDPIVDPLPVSWELAPGFTNDKRVLFNGAIFDDQLYVMRDFYLSKVLPNGEGFHSFHGAKVGMELPFTSDYFVTTEQNPAALVFIPSKSPVSSQAKRKRLFLSEVSSELSGFGLANAPAHFAANSKGQMVALLTNNSLVNEIYLFHVFVSQTLHWNIDSVSFERIEINSSGTANRVLAVGDHFFVSVSSGLPSDRGTWLVRPDGTSQKVLDDLLFSFLPIDNELYAAGQNGLYLSTNEGFTWAYLGSYVSKGDGLADLNVQLGYGIIENQVVSFTDSKIFVIERRPDGTFGRKSLNTNGLEGNKIIRLFHWSDKVFAVTLTGLYNVGDNDFFRDK